MNIFVAGATGAIGRPLIAGLIRGGHSVTGMTRSEAGARRLKDLGAAVVVGSALDAPAVDKAIQQSRAEVVIDELTSLPTNPNDIAAALPGDRELRIKGGSNLIWAAHMQGVRRYILQSSGFFLKTDADLADESAGMAIDATGGVGMSATTYAELEARLARLKGFETVALRYGFFYGPNTWYDPAGACAEMAKRQEMAIIGDGQAVWSWIHIDDAAAATVAAVTASPGVYNIVDDDPSPVSVWMPAFAKFVGAPPPPRVPVETALKEMGEVAVYYGTKLHGASNRKAKATLPFKPRRLEWLAK
jgi:nucleoside-diphosphate-sugar epimerase